MEQMETKIREMVSKIAETDVVFSADADFREELGLDSYRGVELSFEIERVFKVSIPADKLPELRTLRSSVALVASLQSAH
jgi:acyl carrier protein